MLKKISLVVWALLLVVPFGVVRQGVSVAAVEACSIASNPHNFTPNTTDSAVLTISNTGAEDADDIQWIQVLRPVGVSLTAVTFGGAWTVDYLDGDEFRLTGDAISPADSFDIIVDFAVAESQAEPSNWFSYVSNDPGGSDTTACTNDDASADISESPFEITSPVVKDITSSSATITWSSNRLSSGRVNYGTSISYDKSLESPQDEYSLDHSFTLSNLTPGVAYHYNVESQTEVGQTAQSGDNIFTTPTVTKTVVVQNSSPSTGGSETVKPEIVIDTVLDRAYTTSPVISGKASDNISVVSVEYTLDGGLNWLPVDVASSLGQRQTDFSFTPPNLDDGNYDIIVRATDSSNNVGASDKIILIIDRLPPNIGNSAIYLGSLPIYPDENGDFVLPISTDSRMSINVVGGAISATVTARLKNVEEVVQNFSLTRSSETGLWNGVMNFAKQGEYILEVHTVDGVGNAVTKKLGSIKVKAAGKIRSGSTSLKDAVITVFYRNQDTNQWVKWDAEAYGQTNPFSTPAGGTYSFILPTGTYYLSIDAPSFRRAISNVFNLDKPSIVGGNVELKQKPGIRIAGQEVRLPWPSFRPSFKAEYSSTTSDIKSEVLGQSLKTFSLPNTTSSLVSSFDLLGKPTIMTVLATWSALGREQLSELNDISNNQINVVPISSGESIAKLKAYSALSGYSLPIIGDSDNVFIGDLPYGNIPTTYFIDRSGLVKSIVSGVLSEEEIIRKVPL